VDSIDPTSTHLRLSYRLPQVYYKREKRQNLILQRLHFLIKVIYNQCKGVFSREVITMKDSGHRNLHEWQQAVRETNELKAVTQKDLKQAEADEKQPRRLNLAQRLALAVGRKS
jgi:hypothetical protein